LLTYSMSPSGPAVHTSVGIVSTSKRSSCSGIVSASRALLFSFEISPFMADPQIQTWVVEDAMSQRIADASAKVVRSFYPIPWMTDHVFFGLFGPIDGAFWRGRSALKRCEIVQFLLGPSTRRSTASRCAPPRHTIAAFVGNRPGHAGGPPECSGEARLRSPKV
jgi:hypothetical protein